MKTIRLGLGIAFFIAAALVIGVVAGSSGYGGACFFVPAGALLGAISGVLLAPSLSAPVAEAFGGLYFPSGGSKLPEQFSRAQALMREHRYEEAVVQIRERLAVRPDATSGLVMLADILHQDLGRSDEALEIIRDAMSSRPWDDSLTRLTMLGADIFTERGETAAAIDLLGQSLARAEAGKADVKALRERAATLPMPGAEP